MLPFSKELINIFLNFLPSSSRIGRFWRFIGRFLRIRRKGFTCCLNAWKCQRQWWTGATTAQTYFIRHACKLFSQLFCCLRFRFYLAIDQLFHIVMYSLDVEPLGKLSRGYGGIGLADKFVKKVFRVRTPFDWRFYDCINGFFHLFVDWKLWKPPYDAKL